MILPSKPMKYKAVSPQQVIAATKNDMKQKFDKTETSLLKHIGPMFAKNKNFTGSNSVFSVVNGRSNVVRKTEEMIKKAERNINIQCSANSLSRLMLHKEVLSEAAGRGIKISIAGVTNKENIEEIKSLDFCDLKHIKSSKNNFISIDGKECMIINAKPDDDNIIYGYCIVSYFFG
jgi:sugar-specific transcriptional regulator TrmB